MRAAKRERAGYADGAERVQTVRIGECLKLQCRILRISRASGQPMVLLDARCHRANLIQWKATARQEIGGYTRSPPGVRLSTGHVTNVM